MASVPEAPQCGAGDRIVGASWPPAQRQVRREETLAQENKVCGLENRTPDILLWPPHILSYEHADERVHTHKIWPP